jgi:hypothetical protein
MRLLLAPIAFLFVSLVNAEEMGPADLKAALEGDWSVVRVSHYYFMGDFDREDPVIFIQNLPDSRLLISHAVQGRWNPLAPAPVRFIGPEEWDRIKTQILEHFSVAFKSEPDSQIRRHPMGGDFKSIEVSVTGNKTMNFSRRFSLSDHSSTRFREFLEALTKIP